MSSSNRAPANGVGMIDRVGVVVIGRNEGERLRRCFDSIQGCAAAIVYVDSGSTDESVNLAQSRGITTVELDASLPFSAARARNAGLECMLELAPTLEMVQFVDGDCEIVDGWIEEASGELAADPVTAVLCGRLQEFRADASVYNRLSDLEWNLPVGDVMTSGGNALMRVAALREVGAFRVGMVAGEEPELCLRLRTAGWRIRCIPVPMALHDAGMTRFSQWWRRSVRSGHAFAEGRWLHRFNRLCFWERETRSNWFWGLLVPLAILAAAPWTKGLSLLLFLVYLVLGLRVYRGRRLRGDAPKDARVYAFFCVLGKLPQALGQLTYHWNRLRRRQSRLIEYKGTTNGGGTGRGLKIAYLVNMYPHVSHSFIRREIRALEGYGIEVERFSVRRVSVDLPDPDDRVEQRRTQSLLEAGLVRMLAATVAAGLRHPLRWLRVFFLASRMGWRSGRGVLRHWVYLAEACLLARRLRRCGARHLHAHFGTNSAAVALLTHLLGGPPYSFTIHGPEEFDRPEQLSLAEKIARAAFVVAVTEFGRSQAYRWCAPEHWGKIHVIHCGVDKAFLGAGTGPVPDVNRLVCVGRLSEQKGQLRLLEALARITAQSRSVELILAGDGPMRPLIEAAIEKWSLGSQVCITGWISNETVRRYLRESRALVLPSFAEGLPVVLMEALALGRPVVTTYVAGIPELVEGGVSGWLVPAGSVEALADALTEVLDTPTDRLSEMGKAGAAKVARNHDASSEAARLAAMFRRESSGDDLPDSSCGEITSAATAFNPESDPVLPTPT
jgi:glycosyltransferase involved in cell wall biosynthesis